MIQYYTEKHPVKRVYFTGTDTLKQGYALCYDRDDLAALTRGKGYHNGTPELALDVALTAGYASWARHTYVEKPKAANVKWFAGIVGPSSDGVKGPGWIDIIEVTATGRAVLVYTDASTTIDSTKLFVQIDSYALGNNGPVMVGEAVQTIDRSTTNGLVQAVMTASLVPKPDGQEPSGSSTFTDAIWKNFPLNELRQNPNLGTYLEYDPVANPNAILPPYAEYTGAHNTVAVVNATAFAETAQLVLSQDATATDNDAVTVQFPGGIDLNGKPWAFEVDYDLTTVTNADMESFVGLHEAATLSNVIPYADGGLFAAASDLIGFSVLVGDGNAIDVAFQVGAGSTVAHDVGAGVPTANTAITVGMYYDGTDINVYINGTDTADPILAATIAGATYPGGTGYLTIAGKGDSGVADGDDINVRSFRVAQLA